MEYRNLRYLVVLLSLLILGHEKILFKRGFLGFHVVLNFMQDLITIGQGKRLGETIELISNYENEILTLFLNSVQNERDNRNYEE